MMNITIGTTAIPLANMRPFNCVLSVPCEPSLALCELSGGCVSYIHTYNGGSGTMGTYVINTSLVA